jgi:GlcNAc-PI de-N-acetylase
MTAKLRLQNVPVTVVAASDGENAYASAQGLGKARELEQYEALARLGVDHRSVHRLRLPDRELTAWEGALERGLSAVVSSETHIVAPWPRDFHPDHEACGRAAESVARRYGLKLTFYLFWTWHRGVPGMLDDLSLVSLHLTEIPGKALKMEKTDSVYQIGGSKMFCSGAGMVDRVLVTVGITESRLVEIDLRKNSMNIEADLSAWATDAFRLTQTGGVTFRGVEVTKKTWLAIRIGI